MKKRKMYGIREAAKNTRSLYPMRDVWAVIAYCPATDVILYNEYTAEEIVEVDTDDDNFVCVIVNQPINERELRDWIECKMDGTYELMEQEYNEYRNQQIVKRVLGLED